LELGDAEDCGCEEREEPKDRSEFPSGLGDDDLETDAERSFPVILEKNGAIMLERKKREQVQAATDEVGGGQSAWDLNNRTRSLPTRHN